MTADVSQHVRDVCKIGQKSACCRYLTGDGLGLHCAKHNAALARLINARVACHMFKAQGDNCRGKPVEEVL